MNNIVIKKHTRISLATAVISVSFPCPVQDVCVAAGVVVCDGAKFVAMPGAAAWRSLVVVLILTLS